MKKLTTLPLFIRCAAIVIIAGITFAVLAVANT